MQSFRSLLPASIFFFPTWLRNSNPCASVSRLVLQAILTQLTYFSSFFFVGYISPMSVSSKEKGLAGIETREQMWRWSCDYCKHVGSVLVFLSFQVVVVILSVPSLCLSLSSTKVLCNVHLKKRKEKEQQKKTQHVRPDCECTYSTVYAVGSIASTSATIRTFHDAYMRRHPAPFCL